MIGVLKVETCTGFNHSATTFHISAFTKDYITKTVPNCSRNRRCDNLADNASGIHHKPCGICHITGNKQCTLKACNHRLATKTRHNIYEQR